YKAIVVDADEYAGELSRYIHLNPVRAGMVERPEEYRWSSYQYYIGLGKKPRWLETDFVLQYFGKRIITVQKRYRKFVNAFVDKEYGSPLEETVASSILGGIDFVDEIKDKYLDGKKVDRNLPALAELSTGPTIEEISNEVKVVLQENAALSRKASIYLCHRYSGKTLKEIGTYFGIGESAVSQASHRFKLTSDNDRKLRKKINYISKRLNP
ncbi:FIG00679443: hypothetical protein, partial [hydrothermal vent metagenome]